MGSTDAAHLAYIYMHDHTSPNFEHRSAAWSLEIFYVAISIMQLCHGAIKIQVWSLGESARMLGGVEHSLHSASASAEPCVSHQTVAFRIRGALLPYPGTPLMTRPRMGKDWGGVDDGS